MKYLDSVDPQIAQAIAREKERLRYQIDLIAAENYASRAVLEAQGSVLTNKYAEGYPHSRYYGGCANVDLVEELAVQRALQVFGAEHANVQPHSGSQANMAAYLALLRPGDPVLAMSLAHGGHLTHGSPVNFSGMVYSFQLYGVDRETETIDYDAVERMALQQRPRLIVAGASSYPRIIDFQRFRQIADRVGALFMADVAHLAGLIAAGVHPSPLSHAQVVSATTHKTLRGPRGGFILCNRDLGHAIDRAVFPGLQGGPLMHVIAAKAVCFQEASQPDFVAYQRAILENARILAGELQKGGLRLVSGGTENHLAVVDLTATGITGRQAELALEKVGIIVNRNAIPFDSRPPQITSGIRVGTPAVTTRGFGPDDVRHLAALILRVLANLDDQAVHRQVADEVRYLTERFPVPAIDL